MKHRLLTLMVAGLFAAGAACAQSSNDQSCDPAKAKQYMKQHPGAESSFYMDEASGRMICTDAKVFEQFSSFNAAGAAKSGQFSTAVGTASAAQPATQPSHALNAQPNATGVNSSTAQDKAAIKQAEAQQQQAAKTAAKSASSTTSGADAKNSGSTNPRERMAELEQLMKTDPANAGAYKAEYDRYQQKYGRPAPASQSTK